MKFWATFIFLAILVLILEVSRAHTTNCEPHVHVDYDHLDSYGEPDRRYIPCEDKPIKRKWFDGCNTHTCTRHRDGFETCTQTANFCAVPTQWPEDKTYEQR